MIFWIWYQVSGLDNVFDTVCHQILLAKLHHYGIPGPSHQLIKSFLERKQFVFINGVKSDLQHNSFGVPQGSMLDPLLFLVYMNDLRNSDLGSRTLFADDTCSSAARGGYSPPIGMSNKMQNGKNTTFLALFRLFCALEWTK